MLLRLQSIPPPIQTASDFKGIAEVAVTLVGLLPISRYVPRTAENYRICINKQAPEIFQLPFTSVDLAGLPPNTDPGFEQAVIAHYALRYFRFWVKSKTASGLILRDRFDE